MIQKAMGVYLLIGSLFLATVSSLHWKSRIHRTYLNPAVLANALLFAVAGLWLLVSTIKSEDFCFEFFSAIFAFFSLEVFCFVIIYSAWKGKNKHLSRAEREMKYFEPMTMEEVVNLKKKMYLALAVFLISLLGAWIYFEISLAS